MEAVQKNLPFLDFDESTGEVDAVIATLGVTDKHGDVLQSGFAGEQEVRMIWGHDWQQPIGKGRVFEDGHELRFQGRMFLDVDSVREKYHLMRNMDELQEWSWGFYIHEDATEKDGNTRVIKARPDGSPGVDIFEVSPVLVGAGVNTRTVALKEGSATTTNWSAADGGVTSGVTYGFSDGTGANPYNIGTVQVDVVPNIVTPTPKRLVEELADAAHGLTSAVERVSEVVTLRAEKNRNLGADAQDALDTLREAVDAAAQVLDDLDPTPALDAPDEASADLWRDLYREQLRQTARHQGWAHDNPN